MRFEFATTSRIIFGPGTLNEVAPMAAEMGRRPLVVTGHSGFRAAPLMDELEKQGMEITRCKVSGEPTTDMALGVVQKARQAAAHTPAASAVAGQGVGGPLRRQARRRWTVRQAPR